MITKFTPWAFLVTLLVCGTAWSQYEQKIIIEPEHPNTNDVITITITNSGCAEGWQLTQDDNRFQLLLYYLNRDCVDPSLHPNFKTTIGPLDVGDYSILYGQMLSVISPRTGDEVSFSVAPAKPLIGLSDGGINGLYFDPDADGHYFYVLETDYTTLLMWTTFDIDGNQAWVFGTGELINGFSIVVDAYINRNEGVLPNGEISSSEAEPWGSIELNMTSCLKGSVTFHSDLPEFGSGEFRIERLAYVKQLDCGEIE